jgi:capsular polysaccharide transport system permease protein
MTSLRRSFAIQRRVIWALLLREIITRFGRENIGMLWLIGEPMIVTVGVVGLWTAAGMSHSDQIPVAAFAITGYSSVLLWRSTVNRCNSAIQGNVQLLYHRNVRLLDVMIARSLLELAGTTASFVLLVGIFWTIGWVEPPHDLTLVILGWVMLAWFGVALGLLVGSATAYSDLVERLWHPIAYLMFPLSGAAFMVDWLPAQAREVILWLPMVHGVEILRGGYFGHIVRTHADIAYMAGCCIVLTLAGLLLLRDASLRVEHR